MSFYDDASLAFLPSGAAGKDGKAYSIKPTNGDGDFTFSRGSNLSATRVGADGLIEKGRENLLNYSNDFSQWLKQNVTIANNAISNPFGGGNTQTMTELVGTTQYRVYSQSVTTTSGTMYNHSIYVKRLTGSRDFAIIDVAGGARVYFNMTTISVGSELVGKGKIEDVGNGWYRLSVYGLATGSTAFYLAMTNGTNGGAETYTSNGSGSFALYGAQLEIGLAATDYIESGATTGKAGLLEDEPRFDYSGDCPSLLLEPSRTNLITQSEYFGGWSLNTSGISSIESNYAISPEGLQNAYKVNFVVQGDSDLALVKGHSVTGGSTYAYSIYIKGEGSDIGKDIVIKSKRSGGDSAGTNTFQTLTGEWKRIDFTTTYAANNTAANFYISSNDADSCLIYGAQAELGSYPTSYIPNHSGGTITRGAETSLVTDIDSLFGSNNTFYSEFIYYTSNTSTFLEVNQNGGAANLLQISATSSNKINYTIFANGAFVASRSTNVVLTDGVMKVALKYDGINYKVFLNGSLIDTYAQTSIPISLNRIYCGNARGAQQFGKGISQTLLFPEALSDADCITLTTI